PLQPGETNQRHEGIAAEAETHEVISGEIEDDGEGDKPPQSLESQIESDKKLWVEVLSGNRNPGNGMKIEFVTPKIVNGEIEVQIDEADIINETCITMRRATSSCVFIHMLIGILC
ncbi:hypothetical protein A2U01_0050432, partial [Trifolium medium]|nr:hypothetical protein [Trifolium medium]